jgi:hypothetical protein
MQQIHEAHEAPSKRRRLRCTRRELAWALLGALGGVGGGVLWSALLSITLRALPLTAAGDNTVQLVVDEGYVNRRLVEAMRDNPRFGDPRVDLQAPNVALVTFDTTLSAGLFNLALRPTATMQFDARDGAIDATIAALNVGGLNVPRSLVDEQLTGMEQELEAEMIQAIGQALNGTKLTIRRLSANDTSLTIALSD